jgi:hypothetical protein
MAALVAVEPATDGTDVETCAPLAVGVSEPVVALTVVAVPGVPVVEPVAVPATDVPSPRKGVLVSTMLVPDNVGVAFCFAPQAAVNITSASEPNKNNLEIFFISHLSLKRINIYGRAMGMMSDREKLLWSALETEVLLMSRVLAGYLSALELAMQPAFWALACVTVEEEC